MSEVISLSAFLQGVAAIAALAPSYQLGRDGSDGSCDCIGLIIGGLRRAGGKWTGTHGSNYAARFETTSLRPIRSAADLAVGEIVFKAHEPTQSGYSLPHRYADHADQRDYYHAGVVTSTAPLTITHCTGPGIITDKKLNKWNYHGWLSKVNQEGDTTMPEINTNTNTATVTAASGSNVNMRASASTSAALVERVPVGASVTITEYGDSWCCVSYAGKSGWMMRKYLTLTSDTANETDTATADTVSIQLPRTLAEQLLQALYQGAGRG